MNIADKLTQIAENEQKVYDAGYEAGRADADDSEEAYNQGVEDGKYAEWNAFWDAFQLRDEKLRTSYEYGFQAWQGICFKPKYNLILSGAHNTQTFRQAQGFDLYDMTVGRGLDFDTSGATKLNGTFAQSAVGKIPPLDLRSCIEMTSTFENLGKRQGYTTTELTLNNIREDCTFKNTFNVTAVNLTIPLEKITIAGDSKIGQDFDVRWCPKLSKDSIESIINALSDTATGKTLTLSKAAVETAFITEENVAEFSISSKQSDGFYNVTFNSYYDQRSVLHFAVPMDIEFHGEYDIGGVVTSDISRSGVSSLDMRDEIVFEAGDTYPIPLYDALGTLKIKRTDGKNLSAMDITAYKLAEYNNEWLELIGRKSNWNIALV